MPMSLPVYRVPEGLSGQDIDQYYRQRAFEWMIGHPVDFVVNGFRKVFMLYNFYPLSWRPEVSGLYRIAGIFPYGLFLPFILMGFLGYLRNPRFSIILWYILFTTMLAGIFYGDSRIRAPIQPYLYLLGVLGINGVAQWCQKRNSPPAPVSNKVR
jgi:hypothetical protein